MVKCEYIVLQYVPNQIRGEGINLGVILFDDRLQEFAGGRFRSDLNRVRCLDPTANVEYVEQVTADLERRLADAREREQVIHILENDCSNLIRASERKPMQAKSLTHGLEILEATYLSDQAQTSQPRSRQKGARQELRRAMRGSFHDAGVWELMLHDIRVDRYIPGDDLIIDCGYRPDGTIKFFHAVPLLQGPALAKNLAYTFPRLAEGIKRHDRLEARLTAIVENGLQRKSDEVERSFNALEESSISIASVSEMPKLAEDVRKDLRL